MKEKLKIVVVFLGVVGIATLCTHQIDQQHFAIQTLLSIETQTVETFLVYPQPNLRTISGKTPVRFTATMPLVKNFFKNLQDSRPYSRNHDIIASADHEWVVQIDSRNGIIADIEFWIPMRDEPIVAGTIYIRSRKGKHHVGEFQSQALFRWYQEYHNQWLLLSPGA